MMEKYTVTKDGHVYINTANRFAKCGLNVYGYKEINIYGKIC